MTSPTMHGKERKLGVPPFLPKTFNREMNKFAWPGRELSPARQCGGLKGFDSTQTVAPRLFQGVLS
jgi:hypothetical protein